MGVNDAFFVEVIRPTRVVQDTSTTKYVVEVFRPTPEVLNVERYANVIEVVEKAGTVINVGAGPELPANPREGQIWIKT